MSELFMVFDVESIGLHGEGFAVGYVVVNRAGETLEEATLACDPAESARGNVENLLWVQEHVPAMEYDYLSPDAVRNSFWLRWLRWKENGAVLVADCCWPVEARFLAACVDDYDSAREWEGPYPLHDLASVLLAVGRDPLGTNERLPNELPAHHPLNDARQSARLLLGALGVRAVDLPEPDCWAILTPNGSKLVPPGEANGRKDAYRLFSEEQVRELLHAHGVPEVQPQQEKNHG